MAYDFTLSVELPAKPQEIYESWMSSEGHTAMTGGIAHVHMEPGAAFDAWDGYISGKNLELEPYSRIKQSWRTLQFSKEHADSIIDVSLLPVENGTLLTLHHQNVPDGQTSYEEGGWQTHYFEPMMRRFEWIRMNVAG